MQKIKIDFSTSCSGLLYMDFFHNRDLRKCLNDNQEEHFRLSLIISAALDYVKKEFKNEENCDFSVIDCWGSWCDDEFHYNILSGIKMKFNHWKTYQSLENIKKFVNILNQFFEQHSLFYRVIFNDKVNARYITNRYGEPAPNKCKAPIYYYNAFSYRKVFFSDKFLVENGEIPGRAFGNEVFRFSTLEDAALALIESGWINQGPMTTKGITSVIESRREATLRHQTMMVQYSQMLSSIGEHTEYCAAV